MAMAAQESTVVDLVCESLAVMESVWQQEMITSDDQLQKLITAAANTDDCTNCLALLCLLKPS